MTKSAFFNLRAVWLIAAVGFTACGDDAGQEMNPATGAGTGAPAAGSGTTAPTAGTGTGTAGSGTPSGAGTGAAGSGRGPSSAGAPSTGVAGVGTAAAGRGAMGTAGTGTGTAGAAGTSSGGTAGTGVAAAGTAAPAGRGGGMAGASGAGAAGRAAAGAGGTGAAGGGGSAGGGAGGATFTQVYGILMAGCGCHVSGAQGGLALMSKATAYTNLVGADSTECRGEKRVVANDPDKSVLVHAVERSMLGTCRVPPMPAGGGAKLPQASLDTIRSWVAAGAKND